MDYNLARQKNPIITHDLYEGMPYGEMPASILTSRFEETDMGPDEHLYDDYARRTLSDFRPDAATFAHEAARGGVNRSKGLLQLRSDGHRGTADVERPEMFLGFGGIEDIDPRGVATEPDFKQLERQHRARMRFHRMDPDGCDQITGLGRDELKVMQDLQKLIRWKRERLKVFSRQLDGRREGLRRSYRYRTPVNKQVIIQSYGDLIQDYALNPQRRANIISKQIIRDTRAYRDETADQDFQFARYTQVCRRANARTTYNRVLGAQGNQDIDWSDADNTKCYRALGILMSNVVRGKKTAMDVMGSGDIDYSASKATVARKTAPFVSDIALILSAIAQDSKFSASDKSMTAKTPALQLQEHLARQIVFNHLTPAHHFLNAEIIYKGLKPGADMSKVKEMMVRDGASAELREENTVMAKRARQRMVTGAKMAGETDTDKTESMRTASYKAIISSNGDRRIRLYSADQGATESDNTLITRTPHTGYRVANPDDQLTGINFLDNTSKERLGGRMGTKYTQGFIDRDAREGAIAANN
jgi:hypothetical protein